MLDPATDPRQVLPARIVRVSNFGILASITESRISFHPPQALHPAVLWLLILLAAHTLLLPDAVILSRGCGCKAAAALAPPLAVAPCHAAAALAPPLAAASCHAAAGLRDDAEAADARPSSDS